MGTNARSRECQSAVCRADAPIAHFPNVPVYDPSEVRPASERIDSSAQRRPESGIYRVRYAIFIIYKSLSNEYRSGDNFLFTLIYLS